jgi:hypothetical protein
MGIVHREAAYCSGAWHRSVGIQHTVTAAIKTQPVIGAGDMRAMMHTHAQRRKAMRTAICNGRRAAIWSSEQRDGLVEDGTRKNLAWCDVVAPSRHIPAVQQISHASRPNGIILPAYSKGSPSRLTEGRNHPAIEF